MPVQTTIQLRTSAAATWTSVNPTLALGEQGYESDTGKVKVGDGTSTWTALPYKVALTGNQTFTGAQTFVPQSSSTQAVTVKAFSGQTANLLEFKNSDGVILSSIAADGSYFAGASSASSFISAANGRVAIYSKSSGVVPLTARGAASQTADLQQWQNSTGAALAGVSNNGDTYVPNLFVRSTTATASVNIGRTDGNATASFIDFNTGATPVDYDSRIYSTGGTGVTGQGTLMLEAASTTVVGRLPSSKVLIVKGAVSQTGNLQEWQDSAGTAHSKIDVNGSYNFSNSFLSAASGKAFLIPVNAITVPLTARGAASQTADLQQWQNSAGTVLAKVNAAGQFVGDGSLLTGKADTVHTQNASTIITSVTDKSASYTLTATDKNSYIRSTGSAITITVPDVLADGESVNFIQAGAGQITFAASGVTLSSADAKVLTAKQFAGATVTKLGGVYYLVGNLG